MECQYMYFNKDHIFGNMLDKDLILIDVNPDPRSNVQHYTINQLF